MRYLSVALFVAAVHILLPTNTMVFWDDWLWTTATFEGDYATMFAVGLERGNPLDGPLYWLMHSPLGSFLGGELYDYAQSHKIVVFVMIILIAILTCRAAILTGFVTPLGAVLIAIFSYAYPAYQTLVTSNMNNAYLLLFMIAVNIYLAHLYPRWIAKDFGRSYWILSAITLSAFFISFVFGGLMFYFLIFLILVYFMYARSEGAELLKAISFSRVFIFSKIHILYILLPIAHWTVKEVFFPRHGEYSSTYKLILTWESIFDRSISSFWENGIVYHFTHAMNTIIDSPLLSLIIVAVFAAIYFRYGSNKNFLTVSESQKRSYGLLLFGLMALVLTVLPYSLIGQYMHFKGWWTRQGFLFCLPVGIIVLGIADLLLSKSSRFFKSVGIGCLAILITVFAIERFYSYLDWQARAIKDEAIIHNLQQKDWSEKYTFFIIDDQYPLGGQATYADYEWSSIFKYGFGEEAFYGQDKMYNRIGEAVSAFRDMPLALRDRYNVTDINVEGCHAHLTVKRGVDKPGRIELTLRYLYYKWRHTDALPGLLERLVDFDLKPMQSEYAKDCS